VLVSAIRNTIISDVALLSLMQVRKGVPASYSFPEKFLISAHLLLEEGKTMLHSQYKEI